MGKGGRWSRETRIGRKEWGGRGVEGRVWVVLRGAVVASKRVCLFDTGMKRAEEKIYYE